MLAVKVVSLKHLMGDSYEAGLRREALVLELAAMQDYAHPNLLTMQVRVFSPWQQQQRSTCAAWRHDTPS